MSEQTPIAIESARNQAFGKALIDAVYAAFEVDRVWDQDCEDPGCPECRPYRELRAALDQLIAVGWRPGSEKKDAENGNQGQGR